MIVGVRPWATALALPLALGCVTTGERSEPPPQAAPAAPAPQRPAEEREGRLPTSEAYRAVLEAELLLEEGEAKRAVDALREAVLHDPASPYLRVRLGEVYLRLGDPEAARGQAEAALAVAPSHLEALRLLALADVLLGEKARARKALQKALAHHPGDRRASTMLAELLLEDGDVRGAEKVIEALMQSEPGAIDGYVTLARLFADRGEVGPALAYVDRALARDERAVQALELKQTLLFAQGRFREALPFVRTLAKERGDTPGIRRDLLAGLLLAGERGEAHDLATTWLEEDGSELSLLVVADAYETAGLRREALRTLLGDGDAPPRGRVALDAGRLAFELRDHERAAETLCSFPPDEGDSTWYGFARSLCVRALARDGHLDEARARLEEGLKERPESWRLLSAMIDLSLAPGSGVSNEQVLAAVAAAREALPDDVDLLDVAVRAHAEHGEPAKARALLDEALAAHPEDPERLMLLARFLEREGDPQGAVAVAERLLVRERPTLELLNFVAFTLADARLRLDDALRYAWRAVLRGPLNGYVVDTLGWAQLRAGEVDAACETLHRADLLSPDEPEILFHVAACERARGRKQAALRFARRAQGLLEREHARIGPRIEELVRTLAREGSG